MEVGRGGGEGEGGGVRGREGGDSYYWACLFTI